MRVRHEVSCPEIGPICFERDEPPQQHDQTFDLAEVRLIGGMPIGGGVGLEVEVPYRVNRVSVRYRRLDGTEFEPDYEDIHHRDETLTGLGDVRVALSAAKRFAAVTAQVSGGMWLPFGRTQENPFERGRLGLEHQHVQFGTGTFDPAVAVDVAGRAGRIAWSSYAQARFVMTESPRGYQAGNRFAVGAWARTPVGSGFEAGAGLDLAHEQAERWGGVVEYEGNLGRTDLLAGASVSWANGPLRLATDLRIPVVSESSGEQLDYPAVLGVEAAWQFGGAKTAR